MSTGQLPEMVVFEGRPYRLYGRYYRRHNWGAKGPSNLHRAIWESVHGPIPKGYDIHHKDENPHNNAIENLECIPKIEHQRQHALKRHADGSLKPPGELARQRAAAWHADPASRAIRSHAGKLTWAKRKWHERNCVVCGRAYHTPYPGKAKFCHLNCRAADGRRRRRSAGGC